MRVERTLHAVERHERAEEEHEGDAEHDEVLPRASSSQLGPGQLVTDAAVRRPLVVDELVGGRGEDVATTTEGRDTRQEDTALERDTARVDISPGPGPVDDTAASAAGHGPGCWRSTQGGGRPPLLLSRPASPKPNCRYRRNGRTPVRTHTRTQARRQASVACAGRRRRVYEA